MDKSRLAWAIHRAQDYCARLNDPVAIYYKDHRGEPFYDVRNLAAAPPRAWTLIAIARPRCAIEWIQNNAHEVPPP